MSAGLLMTAVVCGLVFGWAAWAVAASRSRRHHARQAQREDAIRSALFRALDEPSQPARILLDLGPADSRLLEAKARAMLPALRGTDRETLARLLEDRGATTVARHQSHSRRARVRVAACQLLGDVGSSYTVLDLVPLLDDARPAVRVAAARALGRLDQPTAVAPLMGAVGGPHPLAIDAAADAIQQIHDWPVSRLLPCLDDPSPSTRALVAELLGRIQALESVPALIGLVQNDDVDDVRARAARALGRIGSPRALDALVDCVSSGPSTLRTEAVVALGRLGSAAAIPTLRVTLLTPSLPLSRAAAAALAAITPQGVDVLQDIADDNRHPAAAVAREALGTLLHR